MITHLRFVLRLATFAVAIWILAPMLWALGTGARAIETPLLAIWLFVGGMVAQLALWLISKVARSA